MNAKQPYRSYRSILRKAAKESYPFAVSGQAARLARELAASGLLVVHELPAHGPLRSLGLSVDGITVAGRDYRRRWLFAFGRFLVAMLLSATSGFLGVVLALRIPAKQDSPRQRLERVEQVGEEGVLEDEIEAGERPRERREAEDRGGEVWLVAQERREAPADGDERPGHGGGDEAAGEDAAGRAVLDGPGDPREEDDAPAGPLRADPPEEGEGGASGGRGDVAD